MINNLFTQNNILGKALSVADLRGDVINNNIANADTPHYKKKVVSFEDVFRDAIDNSRGKELDLDSIEPTVRLDNPGFSQRLDENNVDIEQEMTELYKNGLRHDVLTQAVTNNFKRMNLINSIR